MIASRTATTIPCEHAEEHDPGGGDQGDAQRAAAHLAVRGAARARFISDSAAAMTTAASAACGQVGEQRVEEQQEHRDEPGADQPGELGLRPRLLGDGGPRAARRHREPLEEAGRDVRAPMPIIS